MSRLLRRLETWLRSVKISAVLIVLGITVCAGTAFAMSRQSRPLTVQGYYNRQLASLAESIEALAHAIQPEPGHPTNKLETNLDDYLQIQQNMQKQCQEMTDYQVKLKQELLDDGLKRRLSQQKQLCQDLTAISRYAADQARVLRSYMLMEPLNPAAPDINYVLQVSRQTLKSLQQLDNSAAQDPALPELQTLAGQTVKLAEQAQAARGADSNTEAKLVSDVNKSIRDNRGHMLSARYYFWHNTVQLEALQEVIESLKNDFKQ